MNKRRVFLIVRVFSPMCKFASLARMALVWSKVLVLLLLLQLARPISGLRFTVGAHLCAKRAAQPSASLALSGLPLERRLL